MAAERPKTLSAASASAALMASTNCAPASEMEQTEARPAGAVSTKAAAAAEATDREVTTHGSEKAEFGTDVGTDVGTDAGPDSDDDDDNPDPGPDDFPRMVDEAGAGVQAAELQMVRTRSRSRPASERSRIVRVPTVVPRSQRRGLFGRFAILPEIEQPYEYANNTKWLITLVVSLSAAGGPLGSSIFYPALTEMSADLHASETITNLTVALYMLAMSIFPLWWSSFSETFGRRTVYITSFSLFVVFSVLSAVSRSISMLIVMRILGGGASASVQAVGAGTLADLWEPRERGRAMSIFYLGPLTGPLFAPIIGGALAQRWGWQSTMWFLTIFGGLILAMLFFCLPETLRRQPPKSGIEPGAGSGAEPGAKPGAESGTGPAAAGDTADASAAPHPLARATTAQSVRRNTHRIGIFLGHAFVRPLSVLLYLRYPPILLTVVYGSVTFGALFVLNVSIQAIFSAPPYNFGELIVGLLYIPGSLGYIFASLLGGRWIDNIMAREARRANRYDAAGRLVYLPEDRMRENAWLSASTFPAALVWFGWTAQHGVFWLVPVLANFFFGVGSMLVFGVVTTMLTEFMPRRSSGGIALNNFLRNIFSCVGAIVTQPLISAMGVGWLTTMVALLAFVVGNACIWSLRHYGARWRKSMDAEMRKGS